MSAAAGALLNTGVDPLRAISVALAATIGGVTAGCRLTWPHVAPRIVVSVLVAVLVLVINLVRAGYSASTCLTVVLVVTCCGVELARRLAHLVFRFV